MTSTIAELFSNIWNTSSGNGFPEAGKWQIPKTHWLFCRGSQYTGRAQVEKVLWRMLLGSEQPPNHVYFHSSHKPIQWTKLPARSDQKGGTLTSHRSVSNSSSFSSESYHTDKPSASQAAFFRPRKSGHQYQCNISRHTNAWNITSICDTIILLFLEILPAYSLPAHHLENTPERKTISEKKPSNATDNANSGYVGAFHLYS